MQHSSVPVDTDPAVFEMLVERWRSLSVFERVALVEQVCADVEMLAIAGIRVALPGLSAVEIRHELARRRYGARLADAAFEHLFTR